MNRLLRELLTLHHFVEEETMKEGLGGTVLSDRDDQGLPQDDLISSLMTSARNKNSHGMLCSHLLVAYSQAYREAK